MADEPCWCCREANVSEERPSSSEPPTSTFHGFLLHHSAACLPDLPAGEGSRGPRPSRLRSTRRRLTSITGKKPDGLWEYPPGLPREAQGGLTALATYALLASGESSQDPRLAKAISYLKQLEELKRLRTGNPGPDLEISGRNARDQNPPGPGRRASFEFDEDRRRCPRIVSLSQDAADHL